MTRKRKSKHVDGVPSLLPELIQVGVSEYFMNHITSL